MKILPKKFSCIILLIALVVAFIRAVLLLVDHHNANQALQYFENRDSDSFVTVTGRLKEFDWAVYGSKHDKTNPREKCNIYYFHFDFEEYGYPYNMDEYVGVRLDREALEIARKNGLEEKLEIGCEMKFTCDPYVDGPLGHGYWTPILALWIDGKEILSFEEGYSSLMRQLEVDCRS